MTDVPLVQPEAGSNDPIWIRRHTERLGTGLNMTIRALNTLTGRVDDLSAGAATTLSGLTDVNITSVGDNEVLAYDSGSGDWINQTAAEAGIASASRNLTAGNGLTGGGDLSADRSFAVGAGDGISVAADSVAVDETFDFDWTGSHTFISSDAGAGYGPLITLDRASASPATNDLLGGIVFNGRDSGGNTHTYGDITAFITDATDGSEDGGFLMSTSVAGTTGVCFAARSGFLVGGLIFAATNDPGAGYIQVENGVVTPSIELGATDTTLTRASAGDVNIEGNIVYRAGGTDVPIADGGTGASTASAAFGNLKQAATTSATGVVELATDAEGTTGASTSLVPPVATVVSMIEERTRKPLTGNRTYYVDGGSGSDSNDGLSSGAGAFATIQKAIDVVGASIDMAGYNVTIDVANGTYTAANTLKPIVGGGTVSIVGDTATPSNVTVSVTSGSCFTCAGYSGEWRIQGVKMQTTTSGNGMVASGGGVIEYSSVEFGSIATYGLFATTGGAINASGNFTISGGAPAFAVVITGGRIDIGGRTVTISGTPAFSVSFAYCDRVGTVECAGCTFSGSATGARYYVLANSVIFTNGAGATYLPGNAAGTSATGGQYI